MVFFFFSGDKLEGQGEEMGIMGGLRRRNYRE